MIQRLKKLIDYNTVSMLIKNDPDMSCGTREAIMKLEVIEIGHVKRDQDQAGRDSNLIERLSVIAN